MTTINRFKSTTTTQEIFVFGSNREGRHGGGAAWHAMQEHGAIFGQAAGLQARSYAIVTKELRRDHIPVTIWEVRHGVEKFLWFAGCHPELTFKLTPIGCGLAGFKHEQIAPLFANAPSNVNIPPEFAAVLHPVA